MAHPLIAHQEIGSEFSSVYYVERAHIRQTVHGKDYTDMMLRDKSGSRPVKYWGTVKGLDKGCFVYVSANVEEYQGSPSIIARNIEITDQPDDLSDYIPVYEGSDKLAEDFDTLRRNLADMEASLSHKTCSMLIDEAYSSGSFFEKFCKCPGSDGAKYGCSGGLLARVVRISRQVFNSADFYDMDEEEKCVVLTAGLLCYIGAADSYDFEQCVPVRTNRGLLLGIPVMTMTRVNAAARRVMKSAKENNTELDNDVMLRILHSIVVGSGDESVKPMTKEAMLLSGVAQTDAEVADAQDFIENDVNDDEEFTAYDPRLGRRYYTG